jgi:site-specific recombinase XerD
MTVYDWLEKFLAWQMIEKNASPLTLQAYRNDILQFFEIEEVESVGLQAVDHLALRRYLPG